MRYLLASMAERGSMTIPARCLALPLVALLALTALAGCGKTVIDDSKTEASIEQNIESSANKKVTAVDCPSDVEVEKGATFDCTLTLVSGKEEIATMKILNEDADIELSRLNPAE